MPAEKRKDPPAWIAEFRRRMGMIEAISIAFEEDCDCRACNKLREIADELEQSFLPSSSGQVPPITQRRR